MKQRNVSEEEKQVILESIRKVEDENPVFDFLDDEIPLEERLADIDISKLSEENVDVVWEKLTSSEQEEFRKLANSGELNTVWAPWWTRHNPGFVEEINPNDKIDEEHLPKVVKMASFDTFSTGKAPSPLVGFNLINVLYVYVFFQRLFNGEGTSEFGSEFCELCILSCDVLKDNRTFGDADASVCSATQRCGETASGHDFSFGLQFPIECLQDVVHVLMGPCPRASSRYVACALSDFYVSLSAFRKSLKTSRPAAAVASEPAISRKRLFVIMKKLEYLLSWSTNCHEQLTLMSIEVGELYKKKIQNFKDDSVERPPVNSITKHTHSSKQQLQPKIVELT